MGIIIEIALGVLVVAVLGTVTYFRGHEKGYIKGRVDEASRWRDPKGWEKKEGITYEPKTS